METSFQGRGAKLLAEKVPTGRTGKREVGVQDGRAAVSVIIPSNLGITPVWS